ncbi:zinc-finger domain-containing protein [bacterium]|nr:zinc-finger domain-containing protein [bacterium]
MTTYFESFDVDSPSVACDGGKGPLGHPMVYLDVAKHGEVTCPYCSRHYILSGKPLIKKPE